MSVYWNLVFQIYLLNVDFRIATDLWINVPNLFFSTCAALPHMYFMKTVCISSNKIQTKIDAINNQMKRSKALQLYAKHTCRH